MFFPQGLPDFPEQNRDRKKPGPLENQLRPSRRWDSLELVKKGIFFIQYLGITLPQVKRELKGWRKVILGGEKKPLLELAKKSMDEKSFHCMGGGAIRELAEEQHRPLLTFIVAFQSISDYLDTLCDEGEIQNEETFRQLHRALLKALQPRGGQDDYYRFYPHQEDRGYLKSLVKVCQESVTTLPGFSQVQEQVRGLAQLYVDLQSLKHLSPEVVERRLKNWYRKKCSHKEISWYEFAAACGSTLGIFSLLALAGKRKVDAQVQEDLSQAYFPWVCGLHIMLDYLIDFQEDRRKGELNFISYYQNPRHCQERLLAFLRQAQDKVSYLPKKHQHQGIIQGLLALYLSREKAQKVSPQLSSSLLKQGEAHQLQQLGLLLRKRRIL